jgi:hypothetical protein
MHKDRERLVLEVVERDLSRGFAVPAREDGSPAFRGCGPTDYACGHCGSLLVIGVRQGAFENLVFRCSCGAMNRVPVPPALVALA